MLSFVFPDGEIHRQEHGRPEKTNPPGYPPYTCEHDQYRQQQ